MTDDRSSDKEATSVASDEVPETGPRDATRGGVKGPALPVPRGRESPLSIDLWAGAHHEYVEMGKVMPQLPRGSL